LSGLNLVHVDDVAAGHLAAMEKGRIGEHYILDGQNASLRHRRESALAKVPKGTIKSSEIERENGS
jgi:nucleoside-diphosphate-sugar epimerase